MEIFLTILQYLVAAIVGIGGLKGVEYGARRIRKPVEPEAGVSLETCKIRHDYLEDKLEHISNDIGEVKVFLKDLIEVQVELASLKGEIREDVHLALDKHESRYHKVG